MQKNSDNPKMMHTKGRATKTIPQKYTYRLRNEIPRAREQHCEPSEFKL